MADNVSMEQRIWHTSSQTFPETEVAIQFLEDPSTEPNESDL
jgi:hypothetical protein